MKLITNNLVRLSPVLILAVILIFSLTLIPSVNPTPKNLPIAFVNEDQGVTLPDSSKVNMGNTVGEMIQSSAKESSTDHRAAKWITVSSSKEVRKSMDSQKYYAALVIPKDFSQKQASLRTAKPISPEIEILVNQGMNTMASTMAGQMLNGIVDHMNDNVRTQLLSGFEENGGKLTTIQAAALATPIKKRVINVNETGTHSANGNAPVSLFQPLWMASIAGAAIITLMLNKLTFRSRFEKLANHFMQVLIGAVLAVCAGFGLTWMADLVGIHIPDFTAVALFLSIAFFSFFLMISAVLSWLGLKAMPLFVLILFFGAPLLAMAPEFMSSFYHDWIYPWLPMRFMVGGLREIFFFRHGLSWNEPTSILVGIGIGSLFIFLTSAIRLNKKEEFDIQSETQHVHS